MDLACSDDPQSVAALQKQPFNSGFVRVYVWLIETSQQFLCLFI